MGIAVRDSLLKMTGVNWTPVTTGGVGANREHMKAIAVSIRKR
jgi:hypothetical protein